MIFISIPRPGDSSLSPTIAPIIRSQSSYRLQRNYDYINAAPRRYRLHRDYLQQCLFTTIASRPPTALRAEPPERALRELTGYCLADNSNLINSWLLLSRLGVTAPRAVHRTMFIVLWCRVLTTPAVTLFILPFPHLSLCFRLVLTFNTAGNYFKRVDFLASF